MNKNKLPGYYGILPPLIRYDRTLSANAKLLWCELSAIQNHNEIVFASNEYLGLLLNLKERQIQNLLKELKEHELIEIVFKNKNRKIIVNNNLHNIKHKNKKLNSNWLDEFIERVNEHKKNEA